MGSSLRGVSLKERVSRFPPLALCLATAGFVSGNPLPVSSKDSPSSFAATDDWFLSDLPGKNSKLPSAEAVKEDHIEKEVSALPSADAVKGASSYGGSGSVGGSGGGVAVETNVAPSNAAQKTSEPHADAVVDAGTSRRNNMMRNRMAGSLKELDVIDQGDDDSALFHWAMKMVSGAVSGMKNPMPQ